MSPTPLNEFDVLKRNLPLIENIHNYMCVKTTVNLYSDLDVRMANLDTTVRRFGHSGWTEMKPLVVGIKCTTASTGYVYVQHQSRDRSESTVLDSFEVNKGEWYTFKYPLLDNYHTETCIRLSEDITDFTLAILDTAARVRDDHGVNHFPQGYASFEPSMYSSYNKSIVYRDEKGDLINMGSAYLDNAIIIDCIA